MQEQLRRSQASYLDAHVLAVFERACNLVTRDGNVIALVLPQVGNGPLNIVVDGPAGLFAGVDAGTWARLEGERLRVGKLTIDLRRAAVWESRPDWDTLRTRQAVILSRLPLLSALCLRYAPPGSLLALLPDDVPGAPSSPNRCGSRCASLDEPSRAIFSAAREAAEAIREGWRGDLERLQEGAGRLAGLGGGLTPAGDDFLAGAMLWAWLTHPTPALFCYALAEVAIPRTTILSAAFLRAASRGECSALWHALLAALSEGAETKIAAAVRQVLAHGATSGADALAGFISDFGSLGDFQSLTGSGGDATEMAAKIKVAAAPVRAPRPSARRK